MGAGTPQTVEFAFERIVGELWIWEREMMMMTGIEKLVRDLGLSPGVPQGC